MDTSLIRRFLAGAPADLRFAFAKACAERALYDYAPLALSRAGMYEDSRVVRLLPQKMSIPRVRKALDEVLGSITRRLGEVGASSSLYGPLASARVTVMSVAGAYVALASEGNQRAVNGHVATAAYRAALLDEEGARDREYRLQEQWIRKHWLKEPAFKGTKETLAAVDAYIADGLLLGDDE